MIFLQNESKCSAMQGNKKWRCIESVKQLLQGWLRRKGGRWRRVLLSYRCLTTSMKGSRVWSWGCVPKQATAKIRSRPCICRSWYKSLLYTLFCHNANLSRAYQNWVQTASTTCLQYKYELFWTCFSQISFMYQKKKKKVIDH